MSLKLENANLVILAACYLHNFIQTHVPEEDDPLHVEVTAGRRAWHKYFLVSR
jgi:hypothetical protein